MTNTSYLNLFPVRVRRRPSDVQRLAQAGAGGYEQSKDASSEGSPFAGDRVERAFSLMGTWHSKASAEHSVELATLVR